MTNSFSRVDARTNAFIDGCAKQTRKFYGQDGSSFLDIVSCLKSGKVLTLRGYKRLEYIVKPNGSLGTDEAVTRHSAETVLIETTEREHEAALFGEGRSRFTLTHELGHAVLHDGEAMPRSSLKLVKPDWVEIYRSAEHQANRFAASALVFRPFLTADMSVQQIAIEFGVSQEVAKNAYEELDRSANHLAAASRVRRTVESLKENNAVKQTAKYFTDNQCPNCGLYKMFPIAGKYMCDNCNIVYDALQDGDIA